MKHRYISIKRRIKIIDEEGKERLEGRRFTVRINNAIPPSHRLCEGNFRP